MSVCSEGAGTSSSVAQKSDLDGQTLEQLIARLDGAIKEEPENPRSRWYRGQLLKRAGDYDAAMKDFRFIAERDSKHLDAAREIRLYEMRRNALRNTPAARPTSSSPPRPPGSLMPPRRPSAPPDKKTPLNKDLGGLIGKWFKR